VDGRVLCLPRHQHGLAVQGDQNLADWYSLRSVDGYRRIWYGIDRDPGVQGTGAFLEIVLPFHPYRIYYWAKTRFFLKMKLTPFFKLIRFPNLLMIILTQVLVKYHLFKPFGIDVSLKDFDFALLVLSMICLAAAGNIINDLHDVKADKINKPQKLVIGTHISERTAYNLFFLFNIIGVGIGFYLSNLVGRPSFVALFILPSAFLYFYATQIKGTVLVGNLVVSIMVAMIIVMVGIFDLVPAITPENKLTQTVIFSILIDYAIFAFLLNFLREMVKDQEDIRGDYNAGYQTLPVILGRERTNKIIFLVALLPLAGALYYIYTYLNDNRLGLLYALLFVVGPLLYFLVKITSAESKKQYHHLSLLLKLVLAAGLISVGLYQFILL
jgi:4-hydroxybenzoate polyprenyltransferase